VSTQSQGWFHGFYQELKRRRVMRVATLYIVLFWPVIQIADILSPALELPPITMRYLLIAFVSGFPLALILSWLFDLNRTGMVRVTAESGAETAVRQPALIGRLVERFVIGLLVIIIAVLSYMQYTTPAGGGSNLVPASGPSIAVRAIAVLPFVTFSRNRDDEFFSDGLTEELLNVLSKLKSLRVTARTSSFAYKGVNKNIQDIGRELNVDTILEGSVRRNDIDDTIRVTAQLIEVETGSHLWSQTFDRQYRDVFKIQDEIAAAVVGQLKVTLAANEHAMIRSRSAADPEAMVVTSMGRAELAKRTRQSLTDAARYFERAIAVDPQSADAYAGLANAYALLFSYADDPADSLQKAQQAVSSALEIDAASAEAWAAQGLIAMQQHDKKTAMQAMQKAMSLNPSHAMANMWYGNLQEDEAQKREFHARAFELDPRSPVAGYNLANDLIRAGRETEAMDVFTKIVEADPYYPPAYELVGQINEFRGRLGEAIRYYERAYELEQRGDIAAKLANLYIDIGDIAHTDEWIAAAIAHSPNQYAAELEWLQIQALVARGQQADARNLMRPMLQVTTPDAEAYLDAATAGYFLSEPQATIAAWEQAESISTKATLKGMRRGNLEATISAAHAYAQVGRTVDSAALLERLDAWLDEQLANQGRANSKLWFVKAQAMAIRGDANLALIHLQRAVDEGWRQHWRPATEPCFSELLKLPNFQPMMAGLAARMDLMREQLAFDSSFALSG
jgi:TolB-like protein/lipopolysaccharide biosynthesis regulator YciM